MGLVVTAIIIVRGGVGGRAIFFSKNVKKCALAISVGNG
jgi:hypothetical protein